MRGDTTSDLSAETVRTKLSGHVRGRVLLPEDDGYDAARSLWNAMYDRRPAAIVQARGAADVMAGVRLARRHGLEIAIKGGGHNVAGNASCDGGLMLDLSEMRSVRVDTDTRIARVEPGCLLGDVDRETQAHGLVTPGGFISTTGVAGLTLGGGFGYVSRKLGLTVDNLRSVDMVTAGGDLVRASEDDNPDLFWALKGGGGNFGVVTSFEFRLHELGPEVLAGPVVHAFEDAPAVLEGVGRVLRDAPDEVSTLVVLRHAPPAPFLPQDVHGKLILLLAPIYVGDPSAGEAALAPIRELGDPIADEVAPRPYAQFQSLFDKTASHGARNYWKSCYLPELTPQAAGALCEQTGRMTSKESSIGMLSLGGAIARTPADSAPYPHREAGWAVNIQARWREPSLDEQEIGWSREAFEAMTPCSTGGVYVNFISRDEGGRRIREAYGDSVWERLRAAKRRWDPDNVFHLNQNIDPRG